MEISKGEAGKKDEVVASDEYSLRKREERTAAMAQAFSIKFLFVHVSPDR